MSVLISQSVINYVEEENIPALKALLEKCKDVDERNEVRPGIYSSLQFTRIVDCSLHEVLC